MKHDSFDRPVLIVDNEKDIVDALASLLRSHGISDALTCTDSREVIDLVDRESPDVVLLDLTMPHVSGQELLSQLKERWPNIAVIIITATSEIATAVDCMLAGASDYMVKPVEESRLVSGVERAQEVCRLRRQYGELRSRLLTDTLSRPECFKKILTVDRKMHSIFLFIESVAPSSGPMLITGETGVGKDMLAESIHKSSGRTGSYVKVNIAALDDTMFSDSLFGHRKGAFTGAMENRDGFVQTAKGGTIFLDEIGDLSAASQIKLLRILDSGEFFPVGSDLTRRTDARIVFATNKDLEELSRDDSFRKDLYYRLATYAVHIPPLRDRLDDINLLFDHFLTEASEELSHPIPAIPPEIYGYIRSYDFPGNVRELKHLVYKMMSHNMSGTSFLDYLEARFDLETANKVSNNYPSKQKLVFGSELPTIKEATKSLIKEALARSQGNQSLAANMLGLSHQALNKRLQQRKSE